MDIDPLFESDGKLMFPLGQPLLNESSPMKGVIVALTPPSPIRTIASTNPTSLTEPSVIAGRDVTKSIKQPQKSRLPVS